MDKLKKLLRCVEILRIMNLNGFNHSVKVWNAIDNLHEAMEAELKLPPQEAEAVDSGRS